MDEERVITLTDNQTGARTNILLRVRAGREISLTTPSGQELMLEVWNGGVFARHYANQDVEEPDLVFEEDATYPDETYFHTLLNKPYAEFLKQMLSLPGIGDVPHDLARAGAEMAATEVLANWYAALNEGWKAPTVVRDLQDMIEILIRYQNAIKMLPEFQQLESKK